MCQAANYEKAPILSSPFLPPTHTHSLFFPAMCPYFIKHSCPVTGYGAESVPSLLFSVFLPCYLSALQHQGYPCLVLTYGTASITYSLPLFFPTLSCYLSILHQEYQCWVLSYMEQSSSAIFCHFSVICPSAHITSKVSSVMLLVMGATFLCHFFITFLLYVLIITSKVSSVML